MATLPPPVRSRSLAESHERVRSPLARLRGYIRTYVGLEGALLLVLFLALWFWLGLAFDYGFFKLFGIDLVQSMPWAVFGVPIVRLFLLLLIGGGLLTVVALRVFGRLLREFSDSALALVLERRFPKLLGDRLITAVELADLRKAEEQGYSAAMIRETIHEAAERVQQVPVQQAFDWKRLFRRGVLAAVLTLGLFLIVGAGFLATDWITRANTGRTGYGRLGEASSIWFERNILLWNTKWPRRAQLELVNFPGDEERIGKEMKIPPLRVRALEYVKADANSADGWRALTWADLSAHRDWLGGTEPASVPFTLTPRDPNLGLTVDEVALQNRKFEVRTLEPVPTSLKWVVTDAAAEGGRRPLLWADLTSEKLDGLTPPKAEGAWMISNPGAGLTVDDVENQLDEFIPHNAAEWAADARVVLSRLERLAAVSATLDRVDARAALPEMSRTMRKLAVPEIIYLRCTGDKTFLRNELHKGQDNEYTGGFGELKESVRFTVQAEDYYTPTRAVTLVPPPGLVTFVVQESRPAYLYYRPSDNTPLAYLRGRKQRFEERDVLQAGSETSRIDVPGGTDVALAARADKDLREVRMRPPKDGSGVREIVLTDADAAVEQVVLRHAGEPGQQALDAAAVGDKQEGDFRLSRQPDPRDPLLAGLARARGAREEEWTQERDAIAREVAGDLAGADAAKAARIAEQVVALLTEAHEMPAREAALADREKALAPEEFKVHKADLEQEGKALAAAAEAIAAPGGAWIVAEAPPKAPASTRPFQLTYRDGQGGLRKAEFLLTHRGDGTWGVDNQQELMLAPDKRSFRAAFPEVRKDLIFEFEISDTDGVKSKRKVVVKPLDDAAPVLTDVNIDVIRNDVHKSKKGEEKKLYMVTPKARIPLKGKINDDHGLGDVSYRFTLWAPKDDDAPGPPDREEQSYSPPLFALNLRDARALVVPNPQSDREKFLANEATAQALPSPTVARLLTESQKPPFRQLLRDFEIKPDTAEDVQRDPLGCDFPLWQQGVTLDDNQPFYRMDFLLEATDTDADDQAGPDGAPQPHLSKSKETFFFLVVRESYLLAKIGEDEVKQYAALNKRFQELQEKQSAMDASIANLDRADIQVKDLLASSTRAEQVNENVENTRATTTEVHGNYQRLAREEQLNVVQKKKIDQTLDRIVGPLHGILENDFPAVLEANAKFRKALDDKSTSDRDRIDASRAAGKEFKARMDKLMEDLRKVLEEMKGVESLDSIKSEAQHIDAGVQEVGKDAKVIKEYLENQFFDEPTPKKP